MLEHNLISLTGIKTSSTSTMLYVGNRKQDVKLWNKGVTIPDLTVVLQILGTYYRVFMTYRAITWMFGRNVE